MHTPSTHTSSTWHGLGSHGLSWHWPTPWPSRTHSSPAMHRVGTSKQSTHTPSWHCSPVWQVTPSHRLRHIRVAGSHTSSAAQVTPLHGSGTQ
jgi:hypothetical protein